MDKMENFVFVSPNSLEFYLNSRHTHKQLLTLYNPYAFSINFRVLSTSPKKFTVIDPEGVIAPRSYIDIVVRYSQPSVTHCNDNEKFRIVICNTQQQDLGKKDILTKIIEGEPPKTNQDNSGDNFHPLVARESPVRPTSTEIQSRLAPCPHPHREPQPVNVVAVVVSICCIAALLMPTQPEQVMESQWPDLLHISANLKLVFSFVLGLVCMLVLRP